MEYNFYREDSPWVDMTQLSWKMLTDGRTSKRFSKGHVFYNQLEFCENVFIIKHGRVAMNLCAPEGGMRTTTILDGGCIFGHQGIFDQKPNSCLAMVISDNAEVYVLPKEEVREKVRTDPDVALNILMQSNRINRMLLTQIELMSFQRSESRVCFSCCTWRISIPLTGTSSSTIRSVLPTRILRTSPARAGCACRTRSPDWSRTASC